MGSNITLSAGVRQNLLSLQSTASMMAMTQNRLATGKKVNSALDNPTNFFTSSSLNRRSSDLSALLDSMSNGVKTLEAADNGLSAITKNLESMQSTLRQARQDKSFQTGSYTVDSTDATAAGVDTNAEAVTMAFSGGSVGTTPVEVDLATGRGQTTGGVNYAALNFANTAAHDGELHFDLALNGGTAVAVTVEATADDTMSVTVGTTTVAGIAVADDGAVTGAELVGILNQGLDAAGIGITATFGDVTATRVSFTADASAATGASTAAVAVSNVTVANAVTAASFGYASSSSLVTSVTARTTDQLVSAINNSTGLEGKIRGSNDNGKLRIENLSTQELTVTGYNSTDATVDGGTGTTTIGGNTVRTKLADQFNELRDQLDKLSDDASFNGVNLLRGDKLSITFNETGTSAIDIQTEDGESLNAAFLSISNIEATSLDSDTSIDSLLSNLKEALNTISSQASTFGSNLSMVENRQDFTKNMINTLQTGADSLVLADTNEEGANLLALQTRQQLSTTALSLSAQADQAVLRLF
jgi:flagellin